MHIKGYTRKENKVFLVRLHGRLVTIADLDTTDGHGFEPYIDSVSLYLRRLVHQVLANCFKKKKKSEKPTGI